MQLPGSAQEVADVIGTEQALFLIGQLPRSYRLRKGVEWAEPTVVLYVPKTIRPDHHLVRLLGWNDAQKMARAFGGEILKLSRCVEVYRRWRDSSIVRLHEQGVPVPTIAEWMQVCERHVRNQIKEKLREDTTAANDNTSPEPISYRQAAS